MKYFRFTIRELLLLVTLIIVTILLVQTRFELTSLRPKIKRLQLEVGELDVDDKRSFHVIQVPTRDLYHWRWRISLPDGFDCHVHSYSGFVPKAGFKSKRYVYNSGYIGSYDDHREFFLDLDVGKNYQGDYSLNLTYNNETAIINTFDDGPPDWLKGTAMYSTEICGDREIATIAPDSEVYLVRIRTRAPGKKHDGEGILVWLSTNKDQLPRIPKSAKDN